MALVLIEATTEAFAVRAALDVAEQAIVVIDSRDRVLAFNRPALALFSATRVGADAAALLAQPESPPRWWEPGVAGRRKMWVIRAVQPGSLHPASVRARAPPLRRARRQAQG